MSGDEKIGIFALIICTIIFIYIVSEIIEFAINKNTSYEFWKDNNKFISNNCYIENGIPVCEYNDQIIEVDSYSRKEK